MNKKITRVLSVVLALTLLMGIAPMNVFARPAQPQLVFCPITQVYNLPEGAIMPRGMAPMSSAPAVNFWWDHVMGGGYLCDCCGVPNPWGGVTVNIRASVRANGVALFDGITAQRVNSTLSGWTIANGQSASFGSVTAFGRTDHLTFSVGFANAQGTLIRVTVSINGGGFNPIIN